jgi:2-polyprenyl-3-methyl-5-hydroxy-6-metoxy-1,4-benzoquinol methylase
MLGLREVVDSWRKADPKFIHPTREHVSEQAYWDSGKPQAELVYELVGDGAHVLDFGCGDGRIAIPMVKLGLSVTAVDAAPEMIERLHHNANVQETEGTFYTFIWDGITPAPFTAWTFDAINARAVFIHHAHTDVEKMVANLAARINPQGFLVADWPVGDHHERVDWIDVTTWDHRARGNIARAAGLELVREGVPTVSPSIWQKIA